MYVCQLQLQFRSRLELFLIGKVVHIMRIIILFFHASFFVPNLFGGRARRGEDGQGKSSQTFKETKGCCSTFVLGLKKFLKDVGDERVQRTASSTCPAASRSCPDCEEGEGVERYLHFRYRQDLGDLVEAVWGHDFNFSRDKRIF